MRDVLDRARWEAGNNSDGYTVTISCEAFEALFELAEHAALAAATGTAETVKQGSVRSIAERPEG